MQFPWMNVTVEAIVKILREDKCSDLEQLDLGQEDEDMKNSNFGRGTTGSNLVKEL